MRVKLFFLCASLLIVFVFAADTNADPLKNLKRPTINENQQNQKSPTVLPPQVNENIPKQQPPPTAPNREFTNIDFEGILHAKSREFTNIDFIGVKILDLQKN